MTGLSGRTTRNYFERNKFGLVELHAVRPLLLRLAVGRLAENLSQQLDDLPGVDRAHFRRAVLVGFDRPAATTLGPHDDGEKIAHATPLTTRGGIILRISAI